MKFNDTSLISGAIAGMNDRSREIFRLVVDAYVETGEPIGSRTLSRKLGMDLSPATIRNVMADLEDMGLLFAKHTSAGRLPTDVGLRLYVNGLFRHGFLCAPAIARRAVDFALDNLIDEEVVDENCA